MSTQGPTLNRRAEMHPEECYGGGSMRRFHCECQGRQVGQMAEIGYRFSRGQVGQVGQVAEIS